MLGSPVSLSTHKGNLVSLYERPISECYAPLEPFRPNDRVTLVATRGTRVKISSYPWVTEEAIFAHVQNA